MTNTGYIELEALYIKQLLAKNGVSVIADNSPIMGISKKRYTV